MSRLPSIHPHEKGHSHEATTSHRGTFRDIDRRRVGICHRTTRRRRWWWSATCEFWACKPVSRRRRSPDEPAFRGYDAAEPPGHATEPAEHTTFFCQHATSESTGHATSEPGCYATSEPTGCPKTQPIRRPDPTATSPIRGWDRWPTRCIPRLGGHSARHATSS
jgi:hypothetical protein